jgi:hypothetical protein
VSEGEHFPPAHGRIALSECGTIGALFLLGGQQGELCTISLVIWVELVTMTVLSEFGSENYSGIIPVI